MNEKAATNGKQKSAAVVGIVTSIITVTVLVLTLLVNASHYSENQTVEQTRTINTLESRVNVLEKDVADCEKTDKELSAQISELRTANSKLDKQLGIITEILNRLDRRTKRLEEYFYSMKEINGDSEEADDAS